MLSDFINFVGKNPQYEPDLIEATVLAGDTNNAKSNIELAQYYLTKGNKSEALNYFENAFTFDSNNLVVLRNILLLHIDLKHYQLAIEKCSKALEKYPSQPIIYLVYGVALNELNQADKAIGILETGLDYIIDDTKMESDFYNQLSISYTLLNNTIKAKQFSDKAKQLETPN